jgi:transketolase
VGAFDEIRDRYDGTRFFNVGVAEQAMLDIAVGFAYAGKIPVCYSITPFLILRPFETIRTYIANESLPVVMVGSGIGYDYQDDGASHWSPDIPEIAKTLHIACHLIDNEEEAVDIARHIAHVTMPHIVCLKR